jgi:hypothetical protein
MISSSLKNSILALALSALIVGVESQATPQASCTKSSPDCCWVVRSWQLMKKKSTQVSSTSATACCSMAGVTCDSANKVTAIHWSGKGLSGPIPAAIGNLINLTVL